MADFGGAIRASMKNFIADNQITAEQLAIIKDAALWLTTESDPALNRLEAKVSVTKDTGLTQYFVKDADSQAPYIKKIQQITKKLFGTPAVKLTVEQTQQFREKNPALYKEFLDARKNVNQLYKTELRNYIRRSGKPLADVSKVLTFLKNRGVYHNIPTGFSGQIDEAGSLYTATGKRINGVPGANVTMNPKYDPKKDDTYVFTSSGFGVQGQSYYTLDYQTKAQKQKFEKVRDFATKFDKIRKKWLSALTSGTTEIKRLAAILEILYETAARIGSIGNATAGQSTYSISTLLVKHVSIRNGILYINYQGKKGVKQRHIIKPTSPQSKLVIKIVQGAIDGKKPSDYVFTSGVGRDSLLNPKVNAYFRSLGATVTVHKIRHMQGTKIAQEVLEKSPFGKTRKNFSQAEVETWYKKSMLDVGKRLSHVTGVGSTEKTTPMTAIKNYIDPAMQAEFFANLGLRTPKFLPKLETARVKARILN